MTTRLSEIKARLAAATPGPWSLADSGRGWNNGVMCPEDHEGVQTGHNHGTRSWSRFVAVPAHGHGCEVGSDNYKNMEFIANCPTDIEWLCGEVERLEKDNNLKNIVLQSQNTQLASLEAKMKVARMSLMMHHDMWAFDNGECSGECGYTCSTLAEIDSEQGEKES